jgi:diketogulonate reductase-like aldo/keto reductase
MRRQPPRAWRRAHSDSVQIELSVWHDGGILSGVAEYCAANGLRLLAYRTLGGAARRRRTTTDATLTAVAERHGATTFEIALAWLMDLSEVTRRFPAPRVSRRRARSRARA